MAPLLHLIGYPASIAVLSRWLRVVRERRWGWFGVHQAAVAAIVAGWLLKGNRVGAALNGAWLAVAAAWFAVGHPRPAATTPDEERPVRPAEG
jgi:hypothetical protein